MSSFDSASKSEAPVSKIVVTTASGTVDFGEGLSLETLDWVRHWILYALAQGADESGRDVA